VSSTNNEVGSGVDDGAAVGVEVAIGAAVGRDVDAAVG